MNERYLAILRALLPYQRITHDRRAGWRIWQGLQIAMEVELWEIVDLGRGGFIQRGYADAECYILTEAGRMAAAQPL